MANSTTLTIDTQTIKSSFFELKRIEKALFVLKRAFSKALPAKYGSALWWQEAEEEVDRELMAGRIYKAKSTKDLMKKLQK